MSVVVWSSLALLAAAGLLTLARIARPTLSIAERVVALDLLLLIIVMGIAVATIETRSAVFLDVLVVVTLLGFVSTITVARFIERRGL